MAAEMKELAQQRNTLREAALNGSLRPRIKRGWNKIDAATAVPDFPRLRESDILALTFGVYQVRQARRYADQHLQDGKYVVSIHV